MYDPKSGGIRCSRCMGSGCKPCFYTGYENGYVQHPRPEGPPSTAEEQTSVILALLFLGALAIVVLVFMAGARSFAEGFRLAELVWGGGHLIGLFLVLSAAPLGWFAALLWTRKRRYQLLTSILSIFSAAWLYISAAQLEWERRSEKGRNSSANAQTCRVDGAQNSRELVAYGASGVMIRAQPSTESAVVGRLPHRSLVIGTCFSYEGPDVRWEPSSSIWTCVCAFNDDAIVRGYIRTDLIRLPTNPLMVSDDPKRVHPQTVLHDATVPAKR